MTPRQALIERLQKAMEETSRRSGALSPVGRGRLSARAAGVHLGREGGRLVEIYHDHARRVLFKGVTMRSRRLPAALLSLCLATLLLSRVFGQATRRVRPRKRSPSRPVPPRPADDARPGSGRQSASPTCGAGSTTNANANRSGWWTARRTRRTPLEKEEPDARAPVFSPDGKWIAFLSTRPRPDGWKQTPSVPLESDAATDVWADRHRRRSGRSARRTDKPYGRVFNDGFYGRLVFAPDGKRLAFVADDARNRAHRRKSPMTSPSCGPTRAKAYTGYGAAQVWVADLERQPDKRRPPIERRHDDDVWYAIRSGRPTARRWSSTPTAATTANRLATASTRTSTCGPSTSPHISCGS